jgi:hypothetical protein
VHVELDDELMPLLEVLYLFRIGDLIIGARGGVFFPFGFGAF